MHKLRILFLLLTASCLWACSSSKQDDPFEPDPKPEPQLVGISFGGNNNTWQDAPTTRAGKTGLETLFPSFRVWGYKTTDATLASSQLVMDGYHVQYTQGTSGSTTTNTADWEYVGISNPSTTQTIKYWDYSASSYRFFAYAPYDAQVTSASTATGTADECTTFSYPFTYSETTTAKSIPYVSELWFSKNATTDSPYGQNVTLTFAPLIAKMRFKFIYPEGTTSIKIKDIQFCDSRFIADPTIATTPLCGTLSVSYPHQGTPTSSTPLFSWENATENAMGALVFTTPYEEESDQIHILDDPTQYGKWYYVPPFDIAKYEQGAYTINANIDGNHSSATIPSAYTQWKAGYQYTYIFKITQAGTVITFSDLQVEEWLPGADFNNNGNGTEGW